MATVEAAEKVERIDTMGFFFSFLILGGKKGERKGKGRQVKGRGFS